MLTQTEPSSFEQVLEEIDHIVCWCNDEFTLCGLVVNDIINPPVPWDLYTDKDCSLCILVDLKIGCRRCNE
jgi:hypothetical protein